MQCAKVEVACKFALGSGLARCNGAIVNSWAIPGGVTLYHNSHKGQTSGENVGFGRGVTFSEYIVREGANLISFSADGTASRYEPQSSTVWVSAQRRSGDFSTIVAAGAGFQQTLRNGTVVTFDHAVSSSGESRLYATSSQDVYGNTTRTVFVAKGSAAPARIVWPVGAPTEFVLDPSVKLVTKVVAPAGFATQLSYEKAGSPEAMLTRITLPDSKALAMKYDEPFNLVTQMTDQHGREFNFAYAVQEGGHGVVTTIASPDGVIKRAYSKRTTTELGASFFRRYWFSRHDEAQPDSVYLSDMEGGVKPSRSELIFSERRDEEGKVVSQTDAAGLTTTLFYGSDGALSKSRVDADMPLPTAQVAPDGSYTRFTRDPRRSFVPTKVERFSSNGSLVSSEETEWDAGGIRVLSKTERASKGGGYRQVRYSYSPGAFKPTSIATTYRSEAQHDSRHRLLGGSEPEGPFSVEYDSAGEVAAITQHGETDLFKSSFNPDGSVSLSMQNLWSSFYEKHDLWELAGERGIEVRPSAARARFNFERLGSYPAGNVSLTGQISLPMPPAAPQSKSLLCAGSRAEGNMRGSCGPGSMPGTGDSNSPGKPGSGFGACTFGCECGPTEDGCEQVCISTEPPPSRGMCDQGYHEVLVIPPCNPECANKTDCAACFKSCEPD